MIDTLQEVKSILKKYNQEHLLNGYQDLDERKKNELLKQMKNLIKMIR